MKFFVFDNGLKIAEFLFLDHANLFVAAELAATGRTLFVAENMETH